MPTQPAELCMICNVFQRVPALLQNFSFPPPSSSFLHPSLLLSVLVGECCEHSKIIVKLSATVFTAAGCCDYWKTPSQSPWIHSILSCTSTWSPVGAACRQRLLQVTGTKGTERKPQCLLRVYLHFQRYNPWRRIWRPLTASQSGWGWPLLVESIWSSPLLKQGHPEQGVQVSRTSPEIPTARFQVTALKSWRI